MDQVELARAAERVGDVERLPDAPVDVAVLLVGPLADPVELRERDRVQRGEQRHVDAALREAVGQQPRHELPRPVVAGRRAPGDRPEEREPSFGQRRLEAGGVEGEQRLEVGERRLGALVAVDVGLAEAVVAAAGGEVVDGPLEPVAAQEPLEGAHRVASARRPSPVATKASTSASTSAAASSGCSSP